MQPQKHGIQLTNYGDFINKDCPKSSIDDMFANMYLGFSLLQVRASDIKHIFVPETLLLLLASQLHQCIQLMTQDFQPMKNKRQEDI